MGDVGQGDGVAAADALAGKLFYEIAQEEVYGIGVGEVFDAVEEFVGNRFLLAPLALGGLADCGVGTGRNRHRLGACCSDGLWCRCTGTWRRWQDLGW